MFTETFEPKYRLHYQWEYRRFFNHSQVIRLSECILFRIPNQLDHFRLGITIKAKANSVGRNKVKRQLREYFRAHKDSMGCFDYNVVIPKTKSLKHPYPIHLRKCLQEQLLHAISSR